MTTHTTDTTTGLSVGDRVVRTQGRPANVGRTGVITTIHNHYLSIGSAGDVLVTVTEDDGTTFDCYTRQLVTAP